MAAPAAAGFYVVHDVENIAGLHLAVNAISEGMEQRLFQLGCAPVPAAQQQVNQDVFQLANAVRDCGLLPDMQTPDSVRVQTCCAGPPVDAPQLDHPGSWGEVRTGRDEA